MRQPWQPRRPSPLLGRSMMRSWTRCTGGARGGATPWWVLRRPHRKQAGFEHSVPHVIAAAGRAGSPYCMDQCAIAAPAPGRASKPAGRAGKEVGDRAGAALHSGRPPRSQAEEGRLHHSAGRRPRLCFWRPAACANQSMSPSHPLWLSGFGLNWLHGWDPCLFVCLPLSVCLLLDRLHG